VGINLSLPIHNRIAQADVVRDQLQVRQSQVRIRQIENQIRLEVEDALIALERTRSAYLAAAETRKLQEQSLEIEQERFAAGLTDPLDTPARARWPLDPGAEAVRGAGVKA
jgi:outer membrane protein TolC